MSKLLKKLLDDETGFVISTELILVATIVSLSMVIGLSEVARAVNTELVDVANAYNRLNQGGRYKGLAWNDSDWSPVEVTGTPSVSED
jgi:Flp pilus assembly pilin Flp